MDVLREVIVLLDSEVLLLELLEAVGAGGWGDDLVGEGAVSYDLDQLFKICKYNLFASPRNLVILSIYTLALISLKHFFSFWYLFQRLYNF